MKLTHHFFATCARGTEAALAEELREIGLGDVDPANGGARFSGDLSAGMRACLWSRLAARVLLEVGAGPAKGSSPLHESALAVPWEDHVNADRTFAVRATLRASELTHSHFVALKVKDAIADRLRSRTGARPDVDTRRPDLPVSVHIERDRATFYLDMAGEPLHRRGWRSKGGKAPLKETLAAAILRIGGYDPELPFCDPMCGSGTLAIEAALRARRIAPGLNRGFAFERWPTFGIDERARWRELRELAKESSLQRAPSLLIAGDHSSEAVEDTRANLRRAGVDRDVTVESMDARSPSDVPQGCQVFTNPPYGERLGRRRLQLEGLYRKLGEAWLERPGVSRVVILSAGGKMEESLGAAPSSRHELHNGPLRCRLLVYVPR